MASLHISSDEKRLQTARDKVADVTGGLHNLWSLHHALDVYFVPQKILQSDQEVS